MNGKVIFIVGPSFVGKTFFVTKLVEHLEHVDVVNFELFYSKGKNAATSYDEFIQHLKRKVQEGHSVIAECTGHLLFSHRDLEGLGKCHAVSVTPCIEDHMERFGKCLKEFGLRSIVTRTGGHGVVEMRKSFKTAHRNNCNKDLILDFKYTGNNFDETLVNIKGIFEGGI